MGVTAAWLSACWASPANWTPSSKTLDGPRFLSPLQQIKHPLPCHMQQTPAHCTSFTQFLDTHSMRSSQHKESLSACSEGTEYFNSSLSPTHTQNLCFPEQFAFKIHGQKQQHWLHNPALDAPWFHWRCRRQRLNSQEEEASCNQELSCTKWSGRCSTYRRSHLANRCQGQTTSSNYIVLSQC